MNSAQPAVSPGWQVVFISFAIVVILLEMLRGWRLGLMRQLVRILAALAAYACAVWAGASIVPFIRPILKMPDAVLAIIGSTILALIAYAIITTVGTVLFRRTSQHQSGVVRMIWGSSGAVLGIFFGLFFAWLVFAGVRLIGSAAAAQMHSRYAATNKLIMPVWNRPLQIQGQSTPPEQPNEPLVRSLVLMKWSLESGSVGEALQQIDPLPPATYRTLEKLGAVAGNAGSAERFLSLLGAREIGENPKIVALRNDPEIAELAAHGRFVELLQNQRVIDAANDPAVRDRIRRFDLERALDYAMEKK